MADFVKRADLAFVAQLKIFTDKLPNYQMALGLTLPQMDAVNADDEFMAFVMLSNEAAEGYKQGWTELKDATRKGTGNTPITSFPAPTGMPMPPVTPVIPGVEARFRALAAQIKTNPAYTQAMGEDLGIVADESTTTLTKPTLSLKLVGTEPVVGFKKLSSDGIKLYSKRGAETDFSFLAVDTRSPYVDNRPNLVPGTTEKRTYQAYFIVNDAVVGGVSDDISIKV